MYDFLTNNSLIICPNNYKKALLEKVKEQKELLNIKYMTMDEFIKKRIFNYDEKAIHYLVKKGMKTANAIILLNNLLYIEDKYYNCPKLDYLVKIKKELDDENLLIYDKVFSKLLKRFQLKIYGYGKLDTWHQSLFQDCEIRDYEIKKKEFTVYKFKNIQDEIEFVFQKIIDLLKKGIDINKICLMNVTSEYYPFIKRIASEYDVNIVLPNNDSVIGTIIGKEVEKMIDDDLTISQIIECLKKYQDKELYGIIINILNKYIDFDLKDFKDLIKYDLLNTKIPCKKYENIIKIKNVFDYVDDDEYVFLLGFNNPIIPKLEKDIDYITDDIKELVHIDLTEDKNSLIKENTINYLKSINNLIISYKKTTPFNTYYPSILLDMMNYQEYEYHRSFSYSHKANRSLYTSYLDDYVKYGIKNNDLEKLLYNYGDNNYLEYNNEYKGIDKNKLNTYLKNELTLSYSSIDNYYKCAFKYYLTNILKINLYEETFMTLIGNIFHDVLRHMNDDDFDLDSQYNKLQEGRIFTNKEKFFLEKLKKDLEYVIEVIKKHQLISGFTKMLYEEKIDIVLKNSPYVHFKGFVDKIMYKEKNDETIISIIDYKTGNPDIKIENLEFGLSMQLPIYLYLVKHSNILKNIRFAGFYLQHILNTDIKKGKGSVLEQKYNNLKLIGYSTNNLERLSMFDGTVDNSEMIKGIKINKNGELPKGARTLSDLEIDEIICKTEKKIIEAMTNILNGNFTINPKILNGKNVACEFCEFKDVCYLEEKNKEYLVNESEENFEELA